jgi:hypothetical protein
MFSTSGELKNEMKGMEKWIGSFAQPNIGNLPPCLYQITIEAFPSSAISVMAKHAKCREPLIKPILHLPRQHFHLQAHPRLKAAHRDLLFCRGAGYFTLRG